jgi:hypothetical protein
MSADQNQHYLPQSYQRGWIDACGRLHVYRWAYNKLVCEPKGTKSTGGRDGLYFIPMAPPGKQNMMEDVFWKWIDQWGADGLALLRTNDPSAAAKLNKDHLATFVMSFLFRNPNAVKYFNAWAKKWVLNGCLKDDYAKYRKPHEPASFEEFKVALEQAGMTELAAQCLRFQVENKTVRAEILKMEPEPTKRRGSVERPVRETKKTPALPGLLEREPAGGGGMGGTSFALTYPLDSQRRQKVQANAFTNCDGFVAPRD